MDDDNPSSLLPLANVSLNVTLNALSFLNEAMGNATDTFGADADAVNSTNATDATNWVTLEEVEHFLGDPAVLHGAALVLGLTAILLSKRFPIVLATVASVSLGLWTGLVIQDRQTYGEPLLGQDIPEGVWVPIAVGVLATASVAALTFLVWRIALAMLTGGLFVLLSVAICRLANVSPKQIVKLGASMLSMYRIIGAVVLVVTILAGALLAKRFHKAMSSFASAHLGMLLLLSGISYFAQKFGGTDAPFSLLDDLARIFAEVRSGQCHLWDGEEAEGLEGCDCGEQCQTEIIAWVASSWVVLGSRLLRRWLDRRRKNKASGPDEERAPLTTSAQSNEPPPQAMGAARA